MGLSANTPTPMRSSYSAPLSSSQEAIPRLQSDQCCPLSSFLVNLNPAGSQGKHTPTHFSCTSPRRAPGGDHHLPPRSESPAGFQEPWKPREARPRNSRHLQADWKQPERPRGVRGGPPSIPRLPPQHSGVRLYAPGGEEAQRE